MPGLRRCLVRRSAHRQLVRRPSGPNAAALPSRQCALVRTTPVDDRPRVRINVYVKSYSSHEVIGILKANGWSLDRVRGSHHQFRHHERPNTVTVPHPRKTLGPGLVRAIFKQAGIDPP